MTLKPLYLRVLLESHNYDRRNFARFGVLDIPGGARFLSSALRFTLVCIQKLCHLSIRLCFIRHSQLCKENIFKLFNGTSSPRGLGKREVTHHAKEWPVSHVRIQSPFQAMPEMVGHFGISIRDAKTLLRSLLCI